MFGDLYESLYVSYIGLHQCLPGEPLYGVCANLVCETLFLLTTGFQKIAHVLLVVDPFLRDNVNVGLGIQISGATLADDDRQSRHERLLHDERSSLAAAQKDEIAVMGQDFHEIGVIHFSFVVWVSRLCARSIEFHIGDCIKQMLTLSWLHFANIDALGFIQSCL